MYAAAGNPLRPAVQRKKDHLWMDTNKTTRIGYASYAIRCQAIKNFEHGGTIFGFQGERVCVESRLSTCYRF